MRHLLCAGFAAIILVGCINDPETDKTYTLSFPLNVGNKWEYESITINIYSPSKIDTIRDSNHLFMSISDMKTNQSGFPVFEFKNSLIAATTYECFEQRPDGLYLYASTPSGTYGLWKSSAQNPDIEQKEPPVLFAPASFKAGDEWVYDTSIIDPEKIILKRIFRGIEKVVTKTGTFDCYKFETSGYLSEKRYHYFYPGVGLVKKEVIDSIPITDAKFEIVGYQTWITQNLLVSKN
jgi:hypothetical protein